MEDKFAVSYEEGGEVQWSNGKGMYHGLSFSTVDVHLGGTNGGGEGSKKSIAEGRRAVLPGREGEIVELDEGSGRSVGGGEWVGTASSGN